MRIAACIAFTMAAAAASGADPQLLNMVMPEAQVAAGVNVEQAKTTPFGQWVLAQMNSQDRHMQEMSAVVGFDPRRDVRELLVASPGGSDPKTGIALARGQFDVTRIAAAARAAGVQVETYRGATLVTEPKKQASFAFVEGTIAVAGAPALVRAALDRRTSTASSISPALAARIQQWSTSQDAWAVSLLPPSSLHTPPGLRHAAQPEVLQKIEQASGGVKFGANVALTVEAAAANAQEAASLAGVVQFLANLAAANAQADPAAVALAKGLTVAAQGSTVRISLKMTQAQFEQLAQPRPRQARKRPTTI